MHVLKHKFNMHECFSSFWYLHQQNNLYSKNKEDNFGLLMQLFWNNPCIRKYTSRVSKWLWPSIKAETFQPSMMNIRRNTRIDNIPLKLYYNRNKDINEVVCGIMTRYYDKDVDSDVFTKSQTIILPKERASLNIKLCA